MRVAVYPGSFDPVTNGHIDIVEKSSRLFDKVIIAVVHNVTKKALFTLDERVALIKDSTKHLENVEVDCFSGLLANFLREKNAGAIIRGLRSMSDFEYEMQMAMMNKRIIPEVDTIFIIADTEYVFVSSSGVKEAALLGGDVSSMVPPQVKAGLQQKYQQLRR